MMKLGLRPPSKKPALKLADILTGAIPAHPPTGDHFAKVGDWGMYANDRYGVCGPTMVANSRKLVTKYLAATEQSPTQDDVFDLYRRSGNPSFDPTTGAGDGGVVMQDMFDALAQGGIGGVKPIAYAQVDIKDVEEIKAAISIFGFGCQGVNLENAQQQQSQAGLWDASPSPPWGGHAVLAGRYSALTGVAPTLAVISWAKIIGETVAFVQRQLSEMWVLIWAEAMGTQQFQDGIDLAALASSYKALTGRELPVPAPGPAPGGPSIVDQIDQAFALLEQRFANRPFVLKLIKAVHAWVDSYLATHPQMFGSTAGNAQLSLAQLKAILDQIFAAVEAGLPQPYGMYVSMVQALMDALLSNLGPQQSTRWAECFRAEMCKPDRYPVATK